MNIISKLANVSVVVGSILVVMSACRDDDQGYVDVHLSNRLPQPVVIGSTRIDFRDDVALLAEPVGKVSLGQGGIFGSTYCTLNIRSNWITKVDLYMDNATPRCQCEVSAPGSDTTCM